MTTKIPAELSSTPSIVDNGNSTAITINSSETVMIGKTADNTTDVGVVNGSTGYIYATRDGNIPLVLNRKTSDGTIQQFRKDNTTIGSVAALQSLLGIGNGDAGLLIAGSVDAVAPYNASTNATRDAAINLGTSTNRFQDIFLSGGVNFSVNANASGMSSELLDDYEEGDWNPLLVGTTGTAGSHAQTASSAKYTKVGRLVSFYCTFALTNKGDYTGLTRLQGLPFPNAGSTTQVALGSFPDTGYGTSSGNIVIAAAVEASQSYISFYEGSRLDSRHSFSDVGTGYYCNVGGTYMTSS